MKEIQKRAKETLFSKETYLFTIKAYDQDDLCNPFMAGERKHTYEYFLRRRLTHINAHQTGRSKRKVVTGMVKRILKHMMRIIVRELLGGRQVDIYNRVALSLVTFRFNNKYRGKPGYRQKQKEDNRNDMPVLFDRRVKDDLDMIFCYCKFTGKAEKEHKRAVANGAVFYQPDWRSFKLKKEES